MKCPKCQSENPDIQKFCGQCGAGLFKVCPKCQSQNPQSYKFCGECGEKLGSDFESSYKEGLTALSIERVRRYLPQGVTEKIILQEGKIEGEHRLVTVMFCDMEGYTTLVEKVGREEAYEIMDKVYEVLIEKVNEYKGVVNELTGDGIMALFGAPIALEDGPQRAIRSAYAIHREITRLSGLLIDRIEDLPPLKMRVGIHTGPVVLGTLGSETRLEFKAVGDTVNLASRIEALAEPGSTFVSEDTYKLTEGLFRFEAQGEKYVKGVNRPIKVYRVIALSGRMTRFDVSAERGLTPFIGRSRELDLLLDAFDRVKAGKGQAISIVSEEGLGKSRLLYEFRKAIANEDVTFLETRCFSYSKDVPYHPIVDMFRSSFGIREDDKAPKIIEKVKRGLKNLKVEESTLPYLLEFLSVEESGVEKIGITPEAKKHRIVQLLKRIVLQTAQVRPLVLAFEDLHWIDKSSEDSLKDLLDSISESEVLIIFTYKPEFLPSWGTRSYHGQINLNRLSNKESLQIAAYLLGTEKIDRELADHILEKTDGVPFFIEEFVKSLMDFGIIQKRNGVYKLREKESKIAIPSTIQDVIMARVDSLPKSARELLRIGAVIEREFSYDLIKRVTQLSDAELLSNLSLLKASELIYERGIYPKTTYIFKHALTREVIYESTMKHKRRKLHEKVANAIEELFKNSLQEHCGVLAEHYMASGLYEKCAKYSELAAKKSQRSGLFLDAIEHVKKRIACLEKMQHTHGVQRQLVEARTFLAMCHLSLSRFYEAKEALVPIVDTAIKLGYEKQLAMISMIMGNSYFWLEENFTKALECLAKALKLSTKTEQFGTQWFSNYFLGIILSLRCEFEKSEYHFHKALELSFVSRNVITESFTKGAMAAFLYNYKGEIDRAYEISKEAVNLAKLAADINVEGMAYTSYGRPCYHRGLLEEAENYLLKGLDLCQKTAHVFCSAWASFWLAEVYLERGDYDAAILYYNKALQLFEERGKIFPSWIGMFEVCVERAQVLGGKKQVDLNNLFRCYQNNKIKVLEGYMAVSV